MQLKTVMAAIAAVFVLEINHKLQIHSAFEHPSDDNKNRQNIFKRFVANEVNYIFVRKIDTE